VARFAIGSSASRCGLGSVTALIADKPAVRHSLHLPFGLDPPFTPLRMLRHTRGDPSAHTAEAECSR
jgi:hypothetical protein